MNALGQRLATFDWAATTALVLHWISLAVLCGSLLALVTWLLVKTAFRRARPALHGALWLIVLLKFILPIGPAWSFSLSNVFTGLTRFLPTPALNPASSDAGRVADRRLMLIPLGMEDAIPSLATVAPEAKKPFWDWSTMLAAVYLIGLVGVAGWRIRAYRRFAARCRTLPAASETIQTLVADVCRRLGVRRGPNVRISDEIAAPFLFGAFKPTLVLSRRQLACAEELEAVILHEIAHLRRGDLLVRHLQWFAGTLLFFWPVVAWVNRRLDLAREHACDAYALRHGRLSAGEYARTLLRAARPGRDRWQPYCPNAMAANVKHVERRIEMILNTTPRRGTRRLLGLTSAAVALGWAGFVLTGAGAAQDKQDQQDPKPAQEVQQVEVTLSGAPQDENTFFIQAMPQGGADGTFTLEFKVEGGPDVTPFQWLGADGLVLEGMPPGGAFFFESEECDGNGAEPRRMMLHSIGGMSDKALASFLEKHPSADANGDGQLTNVEREAYLVALALSDPAAVLAKYPNADRNKDGKLDAMEAARLVQGGEMKDHLKMRTPRFTGTTKMEAVGGPIQESATGEAKSEVRVIQLQGEAIQATDAPARVRVAAPEGGAADADGGNKQIMIRRSGGPSGMPEPAFKWLLININATPTAADVARYVPVVEEAPLAAFLEMNPKADANRDGKLTPAERDAFIERQTSEMRKRVLEKHPEADANGDGVLTDEEMRAFHASQVPAGAKMRTLSGGGAGNVLIVNPETSADGQVQMKVEVRPAGGEPR